VELPQAPSAALRQAAVITPISDRPTTACRVVAADTPSGIMSLVQPESAAELGRRATTHDFSREATSWLRVCE
jgi:hypothetical protein